MTCPNPDQAPYRSRHVISTDKWYDMELLETKPGGVTVWQWKLIGEGAEGQAKARKWEDA